MIKKFFIFMFIFILILGINSSSFCYPIKGSEIKINIEFDDWNDISVEFDILRNEFDIDFGFRHRTIILPDDKIYPNYI